MKRLKLFEVIFSTFVLSLSSMVGFAQSKDKTVRWISTRGEEILQDITGNTSIHWQMDRFGSLKITTYKSEKMESKMVIKKYIYLNVYELDPNESAIQKQEADLNGSGLVLQCQNEKGDCIKTRNYFENADFETLATSSYSFPLTDSYDVEKGERLEKILIHAIKLARGDTSDTDENLFESKPDSPSHTPTNSRDSFEPIEKGLILDLNADFGVQTEDSARIIQWENMIRDFPAQYFDNRDEGREITGSGRPTLKKDEPKIGGHNTIVFHRQELVNHKEDAFDHLITGNGYTWFAVISPYRQVQGLEDVNSFFGNLKNGGKYEGFWAGLTDDNKAWTGSRNGITFGRWDKNNPKVLSSQSLNTGRYYLIMARMGSGLGEVPIELFINTLNPVVVKPFPVNSLANPSKFAIGQEREATNHPGRESFDGEIARFLLYERPLSQREIKKMKQGIMNEYEIKGGN